MKKISILLMLVATFAMGACSSVGNMAGNSSASASGANCAVALKSLNSVYQSTGTLDLTNLTNLTHAVTVAQAASNLQQHKGDKTYQTSFVTGMVTGSNGSITQAAASTIMNSLMNTALTSETVKNINNKVQTAGTIISLLKAMN